MRAGTGTTADPPVAAPITSTDARQALTSTPRDTGKNDTPHPRSRCQRRLLRGRPSTLLVQTRSGWLGSLCLTERLACASIRERPLSAGRLSSIQSPAQDRAPEV